MTLLEKLRRTREVETWYTGGYRDVELVNPDGPEAADEIERLRAQLVEMDSELWNARFYE